MLAALAVLASLSVPAYYTPVDTGILFDPGSQSAGFERFNDRDEIIGNRFQKDGDQKTFGIYWRDGKLRAVESPLGGDLAFSDINDHGVATGIMDDTPGEMNGDVPFLWTAEDGFTKIPNGGGWFQPTTINNLEVVGGSISTEDKTYIVTWSAKDGYKRYAEFPGSQNADLLGLNDHGDILYYVDQGDPQYYYLPSGGTPQPLATYPDLRFPKKVADVSAGSINDQGWMCGLTATKPGAMWDVEGTIWSSGNSRFGVGSAVNFFCINDSNVAIGQRRLRGAPWRQPVIWDPTNGLRDMNNVVPQGSPELQRPFAINDLGHILVMGEPSKTGSYLYILKPR